MPRRTWRLANALLLLLMVLLPVMLLIGNGEGGVERVTLLFWMMFVLPLLVLPWLWRCAAPEERGGGQLAAAQRVERDTEVANAFGDLVSPVVDVDRVYVEGGIPIVEGRLRDESSRAFASLERLLSPRQLMPLVEDRGGRNVRVVALPAGVDRELRRRPSVAVNIALFLATVLTTVWAGALHQGINLLQRPDEFMAGVPYAAALLGMLGVHEFGHYFVARRHRVNVTLPYFIPVPMGLGTFGAFIQIKSLIKSRRAVFDIGIAGPFAGLVIALPALYFGLRGTAPLPESAHATGVHANSSMLLALMYQLANGGELGTSVIHLSPVAFAGWIGLFITALNLMPVGQLDGGHIAYGLFGQRRARSIGVGAFVIMAGLGLTVWPGLLTWALIIALIAGFSHMPTLDDVTPPDAKRFALGVVALAILVLTLAPLPAALRGMMLDCPYL
jgi:membrane-associated protease RseP (regulator of RpoE activity)